MPKTLTATENLGYVVAGALAARLPVVIVNVAGGFLLMPTDREYIAAHIERNDDA